MPVTSVKQRSGDRGARLLRAFRALDGFPALLESRDRLLAAVDGNDGNDVVVADAAAIVESDPALAIAALRCVGAQEGRRPADTAAAAVEQLGAEGVRGLAAGVNTFDFFDRGGIWGSTPRDFRRHALLTQRAADLVASRIEYRHRDRLALVSLIHDVGKLVLMLAYPDYLRACTGAGTPEQRIRRERKELGVDHALLGGVLMRRWRLPNGLARTIEHHHQPEAEGDAAIVRLADMLAHYERGTPVRAGEVLDAARALNLHRDALGGIMRDLSCTTPQRPCSVDPCPLSDRELAALRRVARGLIDKQIGQELRISASTVRSHLHNACRKLCVIDRTQAVLIATEAGWL